MRRLSDFDYSVREMAYHVQALSASGLITLVRTSPKRGSIEHTYALTGLGKRVAEAIRTLLDFA